MNWLDAIIILFLIGAIFRGLQTGFVQQFFSTTGFLLGVFLGAWLQGYIMDWANTAQAKSLLALVFILSTAVICMIVDEFAGYRLRNKLERFNIAEKIDRIMGSLLAAFSVIVVVWLGAAIFASSPMLGFRQQINSSRLVTSVNKTFPSAPSVISKLARLINPNSFPKVFTGFEPKLSTNTPLPELGDLKPAVELARTSVLKISGEGCGGVVEGSGFIASENLVITNAHVVAGVAKPQAIDTTGRHAAKVIWFDPELDVAILRVDGTKNQPLRLNTSPVDQNTNSVALGYPGGGDFTASPAIVIDSFTASGRDIYNQNDVQREVYSIKADIRHGNSGGPLIAADGSVIGVVFAESISYTDVGYALTMDQIVSVLDQAKSRTQTTSTGACTQ